MSVQPKLLPLTLEVGHPDDVTAARRESKAMATALGFDEQASEEVALAISELASNLVRHAGGGILRLAPLASPDLDSSTDTGRVGIQIESQDGGPGIADVEQAFTDGYSTAGGLGCGLGAVNRLLDELEIASGSTVSGGTRIVGRRWLRPKTNLARPCPLDFGAATRAHPQMPVNGDAFVIRRWNEGALAGVMDGLGHGQFAHRAAQTARQFVERHFGQPLEVIFRGVSRACRSTRGVVMALARFDWSLPGPGARLTFASVGNVEARVLGGPVPVNFIVRRGVIGGNAPAPVVTQHRWDPGNILVVHSDGLHSHWRWQDFPGLAEVPAGLLAQQLLRRSAKDGDDATVLVVKSAG